ncbi:cyclic nucleotide-binding domain-containing protein [Methylobacterium haplocladii]|uniref:Cyclic nucleotide-binding protein n=1 Tax=Methylobacterium haplocladii TaxID=1176176 RepID=A0A512INZ6_9HYPH|nr:Crp/Fnr family transcriptional regulator [Methylobacterium haplocladii]GEO99429.1 cyclic nucleotide-binding protein [Methylobacterium haplocladii]GJD83257.1 CRP-like cAMP-activated global transcriptional regulator [Methylobacterium haplocladii]GLS60663.1 cyclic nucleotide-binding protein [Methylobacterium haplocladii]
MTLDTEVSSLKQVPLFREVEPSRLKLLAFTSERVHFEAGQKFFSQGDEADAAYLILEGAAAVLLEGPQGAVRLALLGADALVGEMGILADQPRSATVTAETAVTALRIDRGVFLELLAQFPQIGIAVMRELALRLEQTNQQLARSASAGAQ